MEWTDLAKQSPVIAVLVLFIVYLVKRDQKRDNVVDSAARRCEEREVRLSLKVDEQEKRFNEYTTKQHSETVKLALTCAHALELTGQALAKISEGTDQFRALPKDA